jgi:hypothetical protein
MTATGANAYRSGFKNGVLGSMSGGSFKSAPAKIRKVVGSPITDRAARYDDIGRFKDDVRRAEGRGVRRK